MSGNVDIDGLLAFFAVQPSATSKPIEPSKPSATSRSTEPSKQKQQEKRPIRSSSKGVSATPSPEIAGDLERFTDMGVKKAQWMAKWAVVAARQLHEKEKTLAESVPLLKKQRLDLAATREGLKKARQDLLDERKVRLDAEREALAERAEAKARIEAERAKVDAAQAEVTRLKGELVKVQAEKDGLEVGYKAVVEQRDSWEKDHGVAVREREDAKAALEQKEKYIDQLKEDILPNLIAEHREKAEDATREAITELFPEKDTFPWADFDRILNEKAEAEEAKAAAEDAAAAAAASVGEQPRA